MFPDTTFHTLGKYKILVDDQWGLFIENGVDHNNPGRKAYKWLAGGHTLSTLVLELEKLSESNKNASVWRNHLLTAI
jgi:hypothetical protein